MEDKNVGGRTPYVVDYETLDKLCKVQCTGEECASVLGVDYDTLNAALSRDGCDDYKGFSDYFKIKSLSGYASLRRRQFKLAKEGNATMLVWLGKNWLGQKDEYTHNHKNISDAFAAAVDGDDE